MRGQDLPDAPFPPHFFDEEEDPDVVRRREIDREDWYDEKRWREEDEKERKND